MTRRKFANVWDAIEPTPAEAAHMKLRSALLVELQRVLRARGWTQTEAARRLGVTQPRVSAAMRGKVGEFSIDALIELLATAGVAVEFRTKAARNAA